MRIVVDLNRCLGYAQCVPLAPDVLQLQGEEALAYDPNPDDSNSPPTLDWLAAGTWPLRGVVGRHARGAVRLVVAAAGLRLGLVTIEGLNPFSCL